MGTWSANKARFVRRFADVQSEVRRGLTGYAAAVLERSLPDIEADSIQWKT